MMTELVCLATVGATFVMVAAERHVIHERVLTVAQHHAEGPIRIGIYIWQVCKLPRGRIAKSYIVVLVHPPCVGTARILRQVGIGDDLHVRWAAYGPHAQRFATREKDVWKVRLRPYLERDLPSPLALFVDSQGRIRREGIVNTLVAWQRFRSLCHGDITRYGGMQGCVRVALGTSQAVEKRASPVEDVAESCGSARL